MEYKISRKVLSLRKQLFEQYDKLKDEDNDFKNNSEIVLIDTIISSLILFDITFENLEDELKEECEMSYYEFVDNVVDLKDDTLNLALKLKREIIEKIYNNTEEFNNTENEICPEISSDIETSWSTSVKRQFNLIKDLSYNLKQQLDDGQKFINLNSYMISMMRLYNAYSRVYDGINEYYFDDDGDIEYDDSLKEQIEEIMDDTWDGTSVFNYDPTLVEDIYVSIFGDFNQENKILAGVIISDFYEYHMCHIDDYHDTEHDDVIEMLKEIEKNNSENLINRFVSDPYWAIFTLDTYLYYNLNFKANEKLEFRKKLKDNNKSDVLKKYNLFMNDTLVDETLYNTFVTPLNDLIRVTNYNLYMNFSINYKEKIDELLLVYFTTSFNPKSTENVIPKEISNISITDLKKLQFKFIISDFVSRTLYDNNDITKELLNTDPKKISKTVLSNKAMFKEIIGSFIHNIDNENDYKLNKEEKKKILKINKYSILDN